MAERKVINKYYPPDFDPGMIPRRKRAKSSQIKIRMMLPMSIRCNVCGEYMGAGKKFNSRKEIVDGEDHLGLKIFRFYVRCVKCSSELTFKTDPKNSDYVTEQNCSRNFEPWKEHYAKEAEIEEKRTLLEEGDALKELETRTLDAKAEMDMLDDLDELRSMSAQNATVSADDLLARLQIEDIEEEEEEEDELTEEDHAKLAEFNEGEIIKRVEEKKPEPVTTKRKREDDKKDTFDSLLGSDVVTVAKKKRKKNTKKKESNALGILSGYDSS